MVAALAVPAAAGTASAQWGRQTTVDVGAIRLTRDDFADTDGVNVAALWSRWNERVSLIASGAATRISDGRATGLALGSASWLVPVRQLRLEGGATATILGTSDLRPASSFVGFGRGHWIGNSVGAWIGGGGGTTRREEGTFGATTGELGGWIRRGEQRLTANITAVRTATAYTYLFPDNTIVRVRTPLGYTDATFVAHGAWRAFELDASTTLRGGWRGDVSGGAVASVAAAWWITPHLALGGALGRQLADPMRATARTRYATIALRFSAERHAPAVRPSSPPVVVAGEAHLEAEDGDAGRTIIRVRAPGARRVEVMSDLTGWEPVALARRGDWWEVRVDAPSGPHHVVVRLDGGAWAPPANLPRIDDAFGGHVGLVVVP